VEGEGPAPRSGEHRGVNAAVTTLLLLVIVALGFTLLGSWASRSGPIQGVPRTASLKASRVTAVAGLAFCIVVLAVLVTAWASGPCAFAGVNAARCVERRAD
jgi:hypothetical protein